MSKKFYGILSIVFALAVAGDMAAAASRTITHKSALHPAAPARAASIKKARTPAERLLVPVLKKRLAASSTRAKSAAMPRPLDTGISGTTPNFGGFLDAPFYPARLDASCLTDPYNCGVAAAVTADFNQDGKPDIAVLQYDGTLNILLNTGSGAFSAPVAYSNPNVSSTEIEQAFAVDVNNDGYPDIVALDAGNNAILVYLNKGGVFSTPTAISMAGAQVGSIALGDVNGDGNVDVVTIAVTQVNNTLSTLTVQSYLGAGDGTFATPTAALTQSVNVAAFVQPSLTVVLGDVNKDGKLDIAASFIEELSQTGGQIVASVALGNGDGSFGALNVTNPIVVPLNSSFPFFNLSTAGVQIKDLNNDGNPDLAIDTNCIGNTSTLWVALGDGKGNFTSTVQTAGVAVSQQIVYVDVTGDGIPDLVQTNGGLYIWVGNGDGTFSLPADGNSYIEDGGGSQSLALADFNGDGNLDIAQLGGDYKQLSIYAGNGKGSFWGAPALASTTDAIPWPINLGLYDVIDVQGKGYSSALFIDDSSSAEIVTAVGDGKGNLTYVVGLSSAAVPNLGYIEPVQADFNGDGKQDLLIAGTDGSLSVALSNGDGTFQTPVSVGLPALDCEVSYAATGDVNGDGKIDVVVAYVGDSACGGSGGTSSGYFVALGNGDGTFQTPVFTAYGTELYAVTLADMNLDGNLDLILDDAPFQVGGTFAVDLLFGNGDGTFGAGTTVNSNYMISQVIAGDYNMDGKPDLILLSEGEQSDQDYDTTAGILLLPGNGDGTFGAPTQIATGNFFLNGSLTDVNSDGIPDLVVALYGAVGQPNTYYGLSTLLGTGKGEFSSPVNTLESFQSETVLPGNFYNDNAPDFVVQTAYGPALYLGQGGTSISLTNSGASVNFGSQETFTATLAASMSSRPALTGTVSFYDGTTLLGSSSLGSGAATYSLSTLSVGTHSITAVYSGDANFNPNTSAVSAVTVAAVAPAFTLSAAPSSTTVSQGQNGVATLTLTANATFSGSVTLACSGAPANASCTVNPASVTLATGGSATATLVFATTTATASLRGQDAPLSRSPFRSSGALALVALVGMFADRRSRRRLLVALFAVVLLFAGMSLTGCGSSGSNSGSGSVNLVAKGTYTVTVTATPSGGSGSAQTATVSVTVQ
jgi:hypothetical protein